TPAGTPQPSATGTQPPAPAPTPDPVAQALINKARTQLGNGVADGLSAVQKLSTALSDNANEQGQVQSQVDSMQSQLDNLDQQVQDLSDQIQTNQTKIDNKRAEIAVLARELYEQPDSLLLRVLRAGSLRDMVTQTSDLTVAALDAEALRQQLAADVA